MGENLEEVHSPFACFFGSADIVTDPSGADDLMTRASTPAADKVLKTHESALHGLLCEPLPLRAEIERDIIDWVAMFEVLLQVVTQRQLPTGRDSSRERNEQ